MLGIDWESLDSFMAFFHTEDHAAFPAALKELFDYDTAIMGMLTRILLCYTCKLS
jgi:hypothetical protein